jgi:galactose mutarotase-like enzyme
MENDNVIEEIGRANQEYSRFHDIYDGLTWRLCRDPLPAEAEEIELDLYFIKLEGLPYPGHCTIWMIYTIDDENFIISVRDLWVGPPQVS